METVVGGGVVIGSCAIRSQVVSGNNFRTASQATSTEMFDTQGAGSPGFGWYMQIQLQWKHSIGYTTGTGSGLLVSTSVRYGMNRP